MWRAQGNVTLMPRSRWLKCIDQFRSQLILVLIGAAEFAAMMFKTVSPAAVSWISYPLLMVRGINGSNGWYKRGLSFSQSRLSEFG